MKSKHGNKTTLADGRMFASGREAKRWMELKLLERAGEISELKFQVPYELAKSVVLDGRKKPAIRYFADFVYWKIDKNKKNEFPNGEWIIEDSKSPHLRTNPVYRVKKHLMMSVHGLVIIET